LAKVPRELFGIYMAAGNGTFHSVGDTNYEFSIQSVSKPFVFALSRQAIGEDEALLTVMVTLGLYDNSGD